MELGAGRFEIRGTLGTGGASVVYRAFDHQLQREVALKLLRKASGRDLYRFKREFRALADIVHPNLVALYELHATGGEWYFTMELVEGVSFIDWVRPGYTTGPGRTRQDIVAAPLDEIRLRGTLVQLADALIVLHKASKLHRDLKPSNLLVTPLGRLALLDFGLVAGVAEDNPEKLAVGTPVYMSPEQASNQPLDVPSDWYSVGAMLYEALTGRRPFEGDPTEVMTRKQTEEPIDPARLAPKIPNDLGKLCMRLLAPRAADRPSGEAVLGMLGATPSPKTRDLVRTALPASFVGRTHELAELERALGDARRHGACVLVRGKSGIGKTTLVRRFLRSNTDQLFVLEGRCFEREQVPFKMLDGVVDVLTGAIVAQSPADVEAMAPRDLSALVRLFPVMKRVKHFGELAAQGNAPVDPSELRHRGFVALRTLLARLARIRPIVMFIDDAHWGDADSCAFLADLIHRAEPGILLVVATRPEDYFGVVRKLMSPNLTHRGELRELEVGALDPQAAAALVGQLAIDPGRAEAIVRAGGGHPLVLTEMARAPELPAGAQVEDLVKARVARLGADAQAMLAVSSIAARPIPVEIAAKAAGVVGGHDASTKLVAERLATLRRIGERMILQPAHDHVRVAVLASIDLETRASWHEALALALEQASDVDTQAVVEHWLAAGYPANAAEHAVRAAAAAEDALAFRRAAELYQLALTWGSWDSVGQRDLLVRQAHALVCAGALDEAATIYEHAAALSHGDDAIDCQRRRFETLLRHGRFDAALAAAEQLLAQIGVRSTLGKRTAQWMQMKLHGHDFVPRDAASCNPSDLLRIDVLHSIASGLWFTDPRVSRALQPELLRAALDTGEPMRVCFALAHAVCNAASGGSRNTTAVQVAGARLDELAQRLASPHAVGLAGTALGIAAHMAGRWGEARGRLEAGLSLLREHGAGVRWELDLAETYWLATLYYLGEWRELARAGGHLLRDAIERGDVVAQVGIQSGVANLAWLLTNRADEARAQQTAAEAALSPGFHLPHVSILLAACNIDVYDGDPDAASRRLDAAWPEIERLRALRSQQLRIELAFLRARVAIARGELAVAASYGDVLVKEGVPWAIGLGHVARAVGAEGHRAVDRLATAEQYLAEANMVGFVHVVRLHRARLEGGPGGAARAEAARDSLRELGAVDPDRTAQLLVPWPA
jgi:tetratricopeptide (TPR) repeat protein